MIPSNRYAVIIFLFIFSAAFHFPISLAKPVSAIGSEPDSEADIMDAVNADGIEGLRANFFVKGNPAEVWKYVENMEYIGKLFPAITASRVKEIDRHTAIWEYHLKTPVGYSIFNVRRSVYQEKFELNNKRIDGDLNYYGGGWKLSASKKYPGWVDCTYENFINAAWYIPYWRIKGAGRENIRSMIITLRDMVAGKK